MAAHQHIAPLLVALDLRLHGFGIAQNAFMQVGGMAQVEQIVHNQLVIGRNR